MGEKVIAFLSGASKAYDLFSSLDSREKKPITIQSGFENVGNAMKRVIGENVKPDKKQKRAKQQCQA